MNSKELGFLFFVLFFFGMQGCPIERDEEVFFFQHVGKGLTAKIHSSVVRFTFEICVFSTR